MSESAPTSPLNPAGLDLIAQLRSLSLLGHAKRDAALIRQVVLALSAPGVSLPQVAGRGKVSQLADLMSLYRFAKNPDISLSDLRAVRRRLALSPLAENDELLAIHDVTLMDYSRHNSKRDRREIGDHRGQGYECHSIIGVDPRAERFLGVLHDTVVNADGPDDQDEMDYDYEPLFADFDEKEKKRLRENHRHQMAVHVRGLAPHLKDYRVIHVADREFDDIFIFLAAAPGESFVIRTTGVRNVQVPDEPWVSTEARTRKHPGHPLPEGWTCVDLAHLIDDIPTVPYKFLPLDREGRLVHEGGTVHREAALSIGSCRVRLYRDAKRNKEYYQTPAPVDLNVVVVREIDPPPGEKALQWVLFTTLPVKTMEEMAWVARIYELRWLIEVFFRLLKAGYRIEDARLGDAHRIAVLLVILSIAAMALVHLKSILGLGPGGYLNDENYAKLKRASRNPADPDLTPEWRLLGLVARYGGWLGRRRDPIGPMTLMRGMLAVLGAIHMLEQLGPLLEEVKKSRYLLGGLFCV